MARLHIVNTRLLDPDAGLDMLGSVVIEGDRITHLSEGRSANPQAEDTLIDAKGAWCIQGSIDLRCALREPGFEYKEDIRTGLMAAAAGGFTSVCSTPDTEPVTDCAAVVTEIRTRAASVEGARLLPVGAATSGLLDDTLAPIGELQAAGCVALSQGEFPIGQPRLMRRALEYATAFDMPLMVTAIEPSLRGLCDEGYWSTRLGLPATPGAAETIAASRDIALAKLTGGWLHLNRISCADTVALVALAKTEGVRVTCDVAAHHLSLTSAAQAEFDPNTKVWPPLRSEADRLALLQGIREGVIDAVVSDHQPHHTEDKAREYERAAVGVSAVELAIPLLLQRYGAGELEATDIARVVTSGPRLALGLPKAHLSVGATADLTLIDPKLDWTPSRGTLLSRATNTPFLNRELRGRAVMTVVNGEIVWQHASNQGDEINE